MHIRSPVLLLARNLASLSIDGYYQEQPINLLVAHHFTGFDYTFLRRRSK
jgi:hypothetical protein